MLKNLIFLLMIAAIAPAARAQVVFRSLEDAWKYADDHNISIRIAKNEIDKARFAKKQSYGALLPQAGLTGSYTDNLSRQTTLIPAEIFGGPAGTFRSIQFGQQYVYSGGFNAQMSILNMQNWYNALIAKQTELIVEDSLANTRKAAYQQIATQFYSYLLMQEAARLAGISSAVADSVFQSTSNKFNEGTLNAANVDIAKINLERAQLNYVSATSQMTVARNNLKALLGLAVADTLAIEATFQNNGTVSPDILFAEDPSVRIAKLKTRISLTQYKASNAAFLPTLNILYNYNTQRYDNSFEPFSKPEGTTAWFPAQYWSLQASLPIFTGGTRVYQSKRNRIALEETRAQYDNIVKQSAINDENLRVTYRKATAIFAHAERIMQLSFDNYQHISNRYEAGLASLDDRLSAFKDYIDYQNQYLNSLSDMLVQMYQLQIRHQSF